MSTDLDRPGSSAAGRPVVVCAVPLRPAARRRLEELLGPIRLVDLHEPLDDADLVLSPPCSPQTIAALKRTYPSARLIVVEVEDDDLDIDLAGPVIRSRRAGADGYLAADSLSDLAGQLTARSREAIAPELLAAERASMPLADELPTAHVDDLIAERLAAARRARSMATSSDEPDRSGRPSR